MCIKHPKLQGIILTRHHLTPKCRGGHANPQNILYLWSNKHRNWHHIFLNKKLEEVIFELDKFYMRHSGTYRWYAIFKKKELWEVRILLLRVMRIKRKKIKRLKEMYFIHQ